MNTYDVLMMGGCHTSGVRMLPQSDSPHSPFRNNTQSNTLFFSSSYCSGRVSKSQTQFVTLSQTTNIGYESNTKLLVLSYFVTVGKQQDAVNQPSQSTNHTAQTFYVRKLAELHIVENFLRYQFYSFSCAELQSTVS